MTEFVNRRSPAFHQDQLSALDRAFIEWAAWVRAYSVRGALGLPGHSAVFLGGGVLSSDTFEEMYGHQIDQQRGAAIDAVIRSLPRPEQVALEDEYGLSNNKWRFVVLQEGYESVLARAKGRVLAGLRRRGDVWLG